MDIKETRGKLDERRKKLSDIFTEAGEHLDMSQVKSLEGDSAAKVAEIQKLNTEIDDLAKQCQEHDDLKKLQGDNASALEQKATHPGLPVKDGPAKAQMKSIGDMFVDSGAGAEFKGQEVELEGFELKTLFQTSAGWAVEDVRGPRFIDLATRPVQVTDLIPHGSVSGSASVYMEETTFTNNAAETAEGAAKPEAALAVTERTEPVRKIAVWIPVTDEQLEDVPGVRAYLNNRLGFMVWQRLDGQILVGDGTAPNLSGFLDRAIQTQAKGADVTPDAIYKAMTKVRVTGRAIPGGVVFHPNDWQDIRLLRTADGIYIWGNPSEAGPERIWGLPIVQSDGITEGTALVGDFQNFSELLMRSGMTMKVSDSHDDYFIKNKQAVRAEIRAALAVYRLAAFCQVTGI